MAKFKHGDRVTCTIKDMKITDAKISIDRDGAGSPYICQNICDGANADDKLGYKYSWIINRDFTGHSVEDLKLAGPNSLDDIQAGDIILDEDGDERKVLERLTRTVLLSCYGDLDEIEDWYTLSDLKEDGYTVKQEPSEPEVVEMTVAEIAAKLGHAVKIVK